MQAHDIQSCTEDSTSLNALYANLFFVGPRCAGKTTLLKSFLQGHSLIPRDFPTFSDLEASLASANDDFRLAYSRRGITGASAFYCAQERPLEPVRFPRGKDLVFLGWDVPGPLLELASLHDRHQEDDHSGNEDRRQDDQQQQHNENPQQILANYISNCTYTSSGIHSTVLICIDLSNVTTAEAVKEIISFWTAMIDCFKKPQVAPHVTFWLIGCKGDLRSSRTLNKQQFEAIVEQVGLTGYRECSAMDGEDKIRGLATELARNTRENIAEGLASRSVGGGRPPALRNMIRFLWRAWRRKYRLELERREILGK